MLDWKATTMQQAHVVDLLQEVELDRLERMATGRSRRRSFARPVLASVGGWLVAFGSDLKRRYDSPCEGSLAGLAEYPC